MDCWHRIPNPAIFGMPFIIAAGRILCPKNLITNCKVLHMYNLIKKKVMQLRPPISRVQLIHQANSRVNKDA